MKKAALYIRVSTDEQARHGYSIGEQKADLTAYAKRKGYTVVGIYADEGISARKSMSRRKELQRLLVDVQSGHVDVILIKCLDRWFRSVADFYEVKKILDAHGVEFECTQERINTTTAAGRLELNIRLSIAQDESDRTGERIKYVFEGKKKRREALSGSVPLGISVINKKLVYNEHAEVVKYIFTEFAAGRNRQAIMRDVMEKYGIKLGHIRLTNLLKNRRYIGESYNEREYLPSLIPYELFQKAQDILSRAPRKARSGRIFLFSGLLICPECGNKLGAASGCVSRKKGTYNHYYRCNKALRDLACSFRTYVSEALLERYLVNALPGLAATYINEQTKGNGRVEEEKRLQVILDKLKRLKAIYLENLIDINEYRVDYEQLVHDRDALQASLSHSRQISPALYGVVNMEDFQSSYAMMDKEKKKQFWQSIISRIEVVTPRKFNVIFL